MSKNFDVAIVGAGPAGLYCAYRLITENKDLKIAVFEQGREIDSRKCPAIKQNKSCLHCSNCAIMSGIAGAGAFSDGKFPITNDFGGFLWEKCGKGEALDYPGLYFAGDGAGYTHSLSQAAANGLYVAEDILNHF